MTWVADTSWLYALVDENDPHHVEALRQAQQPDPVYVPEAVMAETIDLVRHRHGVAIARAALDRFEKLPHFALVQAASHTEAAQIWRANSGLSYVDAVAVAAAWARRFALRSFDKGQLKALKDCAAR